jgi:hypothetical protein
MMSSLASFFAPPLEIYSLGTRSMLTQGISFGLNVVEGDGQIPREGEKMNGGRKEGRREVVLLKRSVVMDAKFGLRSRSSLSV